MRCLRSALLPIVFLMAVSCVSSGRDMRDDRLFFGRNIPDGGFVSEADWKAFVAASITPRFPDGFTVWRAEGQWRGASNLVEGEEVFVVEILHPSDPESDRSIAAIAAEYKEHFHQEAVLRTVEPARVQFVH